jgi:hypothetical protein
MGAAYSAQAAGPQALAPPRPRAGVTSVEAGRYAWSRVFLGARQSSNGGTQALVQIDLTKRLSCRLRSVSAPGATPENDPGNTVELWYQIQY